MKGEASTRRSGRRLRCGFSTGTAAAAAARAALRLLLTGSAPPVIAVRLPGGIFLPIPIHAAEPVAGGSRACVIKDAGDDPDVTHRALIQVTVRPLAAAPGTSGLHLVAGEGVGVVTKRGLSVPVGEPAVNPVPRAMLAANLRQELERSGHVEVVRHARLDPATAASRMPSVWLPFGDGDPGPAGVSLEVEIEVPRGEELARHTLNPRLGIVGGISILGTTGLVKPFSHEAYRETIAAELSVAAANGCRVVVLTTGGKSEKFARRLLAELPAEAFVQIADFLAFAAQRVRAMGFETAVMAAFFGKTVKIAQGHDCTHAHEHPLELPFLGEIVAACGGEPSLAASVSGANTAREALVLLRSRDAGDVIGAVCRLARERFQGLLGQGVAARTLLFDYDGTLLADVT